jgi:hypothetical protein
MQMGKPGDNQDPLLGLPGFEEATEAPSTENSPNENSPNSTPVPKSKSPVAPVAKKARTASTTTPAQKPVAKSQPTPVNEVQPVERIDKQNFENPRKGNFWTLLPSWGISTGVHVAALLGLAAWHIEPIQKELRLLLNVADYESDSTGLEEFSMDESTAELSSEQEDESPSEAPSVEPSMVQAEVALDVSSLVASAPEVSMPTLSQALAPTSGISAQSNAVMRAAMGARSNKEAKREMLKKFGGSDETERAVSLALKWLAAHQNPQTGAWTFTHPQVCGGQCDHPGRRIASLNAATGMALMCFLGAGQTHLEGEYKETVFKGLSFLIQSIRVEKGIGGWYRGDGHSQGLDDMYSHGIAAIAMCEAFGMTRDPVLLEPAQLSINFLTYAQNPLTGGWHYSPFPLGKLPGDTSVVGWQMMALKSAAMAGLNYDVETVRRSDVFLDSLMVPGGFGYHYSLDSKMKDPAGYRPAMTACGVLCRMYSGWSKEDPSIKAAVQKFATDGPLPADSYYNYYATQVMKQHGGQEWVSWNNRMREMLLSSQVQTGHAAGSWYVDEGIGSEQGGRLYITCMKTMMLEVYYRYLPIYGEEAAEDPFEL